MQMIVDNTCMQQVRSARQRRCGDANADVQVVPRNGCRAHHTAGTSMAPMNSDTWPKSVRACVPGALGQAASHVRCFVTQPAPRLQACGNGFTPGGNIGKDCHLSRCGWSAWTLLLSVPHPWLRGAVRRLRAAHASYARISMAAPAALQHSCAHGGHRHRRPQGARALSTSRAKALPTHLR